MPLSPGDTLDGYTVIRPIGEGGFGEVWLCRSTTTDVFAALKFVGAERHRSLEKEHAALLKFCSQAHRLREAPIVPITHVNRRPDGLFYVMPLADGRGGQDPRKSHWRAATLAGALELQRTRNDWFTSGEILELFLPVLDALQALSDAGLVHRDIKPDNILFFNGRPRLADISLVNEDITRQSRHGTPGYCTPSWYLGGNPDMYGAAALLFTLLSGNPPDKLGRESCRWPPQGESSLNAAEHAEWIRLYAILRRAMDENPCERFVDFRAMSDACCRGRLIREPAAEADTPTAHPIISAPAEPAPDRAVARVDERHRAAYEGLLAKDAAIIQRHREALRRRFRDYAETLPEIETAFAAYDALPVTAPELPQVMEALTAAITARLLPYPETLDGLTTEAASDCLAVWQEARDLPQNAEEMFHFQKHIEKRFAEVPGRRSVTFAAVVWWGAETRDSVLTRLRNGPLTTTFACTAGLFTAWCDKAALPAPQAAGLVAAHERLRTACYQLATQLHFDINPHLKYAGRL